MENWLNKLKDRKVLSILAGVFTLALLITYSNHYNNGFRFDDSHTIVQNEYIKDLSYFPLYFTDIKTFGTMPNNRGYRPMVTTMNAIDHWRGRDDTPGNEKGRLDPRNFHTHIMFWYIFQCVLLFFIFRHIMNLALPSEWNGLVALIATSWYALHTANAETINYIISRSDSFSTFCIVASFALYINKTGRKYYLYLITFVIGMLTKEVGIVFVALLFFYILLFENEVSLPEFFLFKKEKRSKVVDTFKKVIIPGLVGFLMIMLYSSVSSGIAGKVASRSAERRIDYFMTQANVIKHYIENFFLPLNLSADPDLPYLRSFLDSRVIFGLLVLIALLIIAIITSKQKKYRPISFGIIWFYVSLMPTSSIHPLGQIANDHRTFLPYIGLIISVTWWIYLVINKQKERIIKSQYGPVAISVLIILFLGTHAYGAHQRNEIWGNAEKLWYDVTVKSPNNGRGLMNYGLTQMEKGNYPEAHKYFQRALEILPRYSYLHINMGILKNVMKEEKVAEEHFQKALRYDPSNPEAYRFYARFLLEKNRVEEARNMIDRGLQKSPRHTGLLRMSNNVKLRSQTKEERLAKQLELVEKEPSVANYLNLSLMYYKLAQFEKVIETCNKVLEMDPDNILALNNICISNTKLGKQEEAIAACEKALEISPNFERAKNNLEIAKNMNNSDNN